MSYVQVQKQKNMEFVNNNGNICFLDPTEINGLWFRYVSVLQSRTFLGTGCSMCQWWSYGVAVAISWSKLQKGFYYMLNSPVYTKKKKLNKFLSQTWCHGWNFSIKLERDSARDFQIMAPLKKHSSQAQTAPSLVFSHRGEPGYEQNYLTKLLPLPSLFSTKAQLSFPSPNILMEMLEQPKKKPSYLCAIF